VGIGHGRGHGRQLAVEERVIHFAAISWIVFVPAIIAVAWFKRLRTPLRFLCLALVALILMEPQIRRLGRGLDLWVLVGRSASAADALTPRLAEIKGLLERSKSTDDRIFYVDYAELAQMQGEADEIPPHKQQQTRTALAIQLALARMSPDRAARLLVLTDGYSTEPLTNLNERLLRQGVPLDYRFISPAGAPDYRVSRLDLATRAQSGEPFLIEVEAAGEPDGPIAIEIARDGKNIGRAPLYLTKGTAFARFTDRLTTTGAHRYTAQVSAANDARPGNNRAEKWIEVVGGPRALLLTNYADDPLVAVLAAQGFEVETVTKPSSAQIGQLSNAKAVILNNVAAYQLPAEFLNALDFYVRSQGGGLLMAGGKFSFGSGGYFQSPIDPLLPVSMELRTEHRKLAVAMAIVLDRSGSMSATVSGNLQKMDLANEGAARAIELLGSMDAVTVSAVDTKAHEIIPLTSLGSNRHQLTLLVRRIASGGGGICVPTGLRAARTQLRKAKVGQRHVILFADANDATQELGDYATLIRDMAKENITISVIGLGDDTDSGADFLREVADLGKGRIFFNTNPSDLPALFAQETVAVARSAFLDQPVKILPTAGWLELAAKPLPWPDGVDGYNLSYLKSGATAAAFSGDEYKAPLVAFWQRGAGRVAAVSFPLGGDFSGKARAWGNFGDFAQTLARWLSGDQLPGGIGLRTKLEGAELRLDLFYDATWEQKLAQTAPRIVLGDGVSPQPRELTWQRLAPGHFSTTTHLDPERWVRGAVQVEKFALPFGPVVAGSNAEWSFDRTRLLELENLARSSGGTERIDLSKIWQAPRRPAFRDARPVLLVLLLVLFVLDALLTRLEWRWPSHPKSPSAPTAESDSEFARSPESTGLEPATSAVTGRRSNQLS
jgi:von Willebrand factor type A domain